MKYVVIEWVCDSTVSHEHETLESVKKWLHEEHLLLSEDNTKYREELLNEVQILVVVEEIDVRTLL